MVYVLLKLAFRHHHVLDRNTFLRLIHDDHVALLHFHCLFYNMNISKFIYFSTINGYLGSSQFLTLLMYTTMNITIHVPLKKYLLVLKFLTKDF